MSDGHFNRSFLPHGDFSSGVRVGKASERALCMEVFSDIVGELRPDLSAEQRAEVCLRFKTMVITREK